MKVWWRGMKGSAGIESEEGGMGWLFNLVDAILVVYLSLKNKFELECVLQLE